MRALRSIFSIIIFILFSQSAISQERPASFADLTEKLMPAVVNISTSTTVVKNVNPFPFEFPPAITLLKICLKSLEHLKKENQAH